MVSAAIFHGDFELAASKSELLYTQTREVAYQILRAIALWNLNKPNEAKDVFDSVVEDVSDIPRLQSSARLPRVFDLAIHYYYITQQYEKAQTALSCSLEWWRENKDYFYVPGVYYMQALISLEQRNLIKALSFIEQSILTVTELNWTEMDESGYIPLTESKVFELRDRILEEIQLKYQNELSPSTD